MQELKIISDKRNELLERREIKAIFTKEGATPSAGEALKEIAKAANAPEEKIVVEHIFQKYGTQNSEVMAKIYDKEAPKKKEQGGTAAGDAERGSDAGKKGEPKPAEGAAPAEKKS